MIDEKLYKNEYETAKKIVATRKLKHDKVTEEGDYLSVRFYYLYKRHKYYIWVDKNIKNDSWEYNQYIYSTLDSEDIIIYFLQSLSTENIDYELDSISNN